MFGDLIKNPFLQFLSYLNITINAAIVLSCFILENSLFRFMAIGYIYFLATDHGINFLKKHDFDMIHFFSISFTFKIAYAFVYLLTSLIVFMTKHKHKSFLEFLYFKSRWIHTLHLSLSLASVAFSLTMLTILTYYYNKKSD